MKLVRLLALPALLLATTACPSVEQAPADAVVRGLGETYKSPRGEFCVIRLQDEFRVLRMVAGAGAAYQDEVFRINRDLIVDDPYAQPPYHRWNTWVDVPQVPGMRVMFLTPTRVAFQRLAPESQ